MHTSIIIWRVDVGVSFMQKPDVGIRDRPSPGIPLTFTTDFVEYDLVTYT